jgi:hypothetical protein
MKIDLRQVVSDIVFCYTLAESPKQQIDLA